MCEMTLKYSMKYEFISTSVEQSEPQMCLHSLWASLEIWKEPLPPFFACSRNLTLKNMYVFVPLCAGTAFLNSLLRGLINSSNYSLMGLLLASLPFNCL